MSNGNKRSPEFWQHLLKSTELRAISGVLRNLENLMASDDTTPKQLAEVILKDVMLTSKVLKIANSVTYHSSNSSSNKGALTQAIVRIGFNSLRAICISAALIDSFLKKNPHRSELHTCIRQSFEVAVHARNVAKKIGANEEDVFIAGLFQNLGELLFWSSAIPESQLYIDLLKSTVESPEQAFKRISNMDFQDMSQALAKEWHLSDLLLDTFGVEINNETKAVHLGRRISLASKKGWDSKEINIILQSKIIDLGFNVISGMKFMRDGAEEAGALAASYDVQTKEKPVEHDDATGSSPTEAEAEWVKIETAIKSIKQSPKTSAAQIKPKPNKPKPTSLIRS